MANTKEQFSAQDVGDARQAQLQQGVADAEAEVKAANRNLVEATKRRDDAVNAVSLARNELKLHEQGLGQG